MALSAVDERELIAPLFSGIGERPVWETFLRRLLARTRARQACLLLRPQGTAGSMRRAAARADDPPPDFAAMDACGLIPLATMRPGRVYALQETLAPDEGPLRDRHRALLAEARIAQARFLRQTTRADHEAWIVITHDRTDFGGADSALLSDLAPHLSVALDLAVEIDALRLRASMAEQALALLGIRQAALDGQGRPLGDVPQRLAPAARAAQGLADACAAITQRPGPARILLPGASDGGEDMLLRPLPALDTALPTPAAAIAATRRDRPADPAGATRVLARGLGLSAREAALALAISRGHAIVEAGQALRLTPETARNYSKRIYAKTGARGQVDLVRIILSGLAPLA